MNFPLVTTHWLEQHLLDENLILIDVSMQKVIGKTPIVYDTPVYIPRSYFLDLDTQLCDVTAAQPHTFPTLEQFRDAVSNLAIQPDSVVVLYDNQGIYSAPRAWWIFQSMGFKQAYVLDGGLPQWLEEKRASVKELQPLNRTRLDSQMAAIKQPPAKKDALQFHQRTDYVCNADYIVQRLQDGQMTVLDARSAERFYGHAPEPRAGVRSGHIPNSINLPFTDVLHGHKFKSPDALSTQFAQLLEKPNNRLVFSCGSGVTACIILMAAIMAGFSQVTLYDGSWAEWGSDARLPN